MDKNMNVLMAVYILGILLIGAIVVFNSYNANQYGVYGQQNVISVSGNAQIEVEPNKAEVYVKIETSNETAEVAKNRNAVLSDRVITALKRKGIENKSIETVEFYLTPVYSYDTKEEKNILVGYTLTNTLKVTTEDITAAGKIIDTAVDSGANGIERVSFGLTTEKQKEITEVALAKAGEVAKDKAKSIASSLGLNLGKITSVQESSYFYAPYTYTPTMAGAESLKAADTSISPQKVEVSAQVTINYKIK